MDGRFVYVGDEAGAKAYFGEGTEELRYEDDCPELTADMAAAFRRAAEVRNKRKALR